MAGQDRQKKIADIIEGLRENYRDALDGLTVSAFEDYMRSVRILADGKTEPLMLPKSNMLKFIFEDGSWFVLRPSETEPKIKMYLSALREIGKAAEDRLAELEKLCEKL